MSSELQTIPARHGVATFVPAGHTIKIINTSGSQVVDTWAFALPNPEAKTGDSPAQEEPSKTEATSKPSQVSPVKSNQKKIGSKRKSSFPTQSEAEDAINSEIGKGKKESEANTQKSSWGSYVPSLGKWVPSVTQKFSKPEGEATEKVREQRPSRTWASYLPSGKAITSYIPKQASESVSAFASSHHRDPTKPYLSQLRDFSRTPVGAAGLAAISGSGYTSSIYAGYQAWNLRSSSNEGVPELLSVAHTRVSTSHLSPRPGDVLVTNLRQPILTLIEDTSGCRGHDTLIPACDPERYRQLEVEEWEKHGSCAENLVLALEEINKQAAELDGYKGVVVGAGITVGTVPPPLNLFMEVDVEVGNGEAEWGTIGMGTKTKEKKMQRHELSRRKDGYVKFVAERDVVVVMSACPQDVTEINNWESNDAHFLVEEHAEEVDAPGKRDAKGKRTVNPRKLGDDQIERKANEKSRLGKKKPIPPTIGRQRTVEKQARQGAVKVGEQVSGAGEQSSQSGPKGEMTDGKSPARAEKRKPRKLAVRPKSATAGS